jgi:hypothetical protein
MHSPLRLDKSVPLNVVRRWLGHARIETTAIYASTIAGEECNLDRRAWGSLELALIRVSLSDFLQECGFKIIEAANADEAILLLDSRTTSIDLVMTDVRYRERWMDSDLRSGSGRIAKVFPC